MKRYEKGPGRRRPDDGRAPCLDEFRNRRICRRHPSSMITEGLASIRKKQQRGDAIKPSETGRYRRKEGRFFPSRTVSWCILVISRLIASINSHIFELTSLKTYESRLAGICAGRPDVCKTDSVAFRSVGGSPRPMPYIRPLPGAGSRKPRKNVWVDSCLGSAPPRMGSISHTLSRPLSCHPELVEGSAKGNDRVPQRGHFDKLNERAAKMHVREARKMSVFCHSRLYIN